MRYAVFGHPVSHSLSPDIHAQFAAQLGLQIRYDKIEAPLDGFAASVARFLEEGGRGFNVTVPFKEQAFDLVDRLDKAARFAGAVNTVKVDGSTLLGFNTDGAGLVRDLEINLNQNLDASRVAILGAGGAVRGILKPLLAAGVARIALTNRTRAKAEALASLDERVVVTDIADLPPVDLVINATSAGLAGDAHGGAALVAQDVLRVATCYDLLYSSGGSPGSGRSTPFCEYALGLGADRVHDGLGMLVEQAALAFEVWYDQLPATTAVLERLRAATS